MRSKSLLNVRSQHSVETEFSGSLLPCRIAIALSAAIASRSMKHEADVTLEDKKSGYMANADRPWYFLVAVVCLSSVLHQSAFAVAVTKIVCCDSYKHQCSLVVVGSGTTPTVVLG